MRKQLAGIDPRQRAGAEYGAELYTAELRGRTYEELLRRASEQLAAGRPVVLDGSYGRAADRAAAAALAAEHGVPLLIAELRLDEAAARQRIESRAGDPFRTTDATWAVYEAMRADFEAVGPGEGQQLALDAAQAPAALAVQIAEALPLRLS